MPEHYKEILMDNWIITHHTDKTVTVTFEDGRSLNYDISSLVNPPDIPTRFLGTDLPNNSTGVSVAGTTYKFLANGVFDSHKHTTEETDHNIECVEGRVLVKRDYQGDIELGPGETANIEVNEIHSIHALEPSKTVHWLKI